VTISFSVYLVLSLFFVMCGCFDNFVGVLVIRVIIFTVFCIVLFLYLFLLSVLV